MTLESRERISNKIIKAYLLGAIVIGFAAAEVIELATETKNRVKRILNP